MRRSASPTRRGGSRPVVAQLTSVHLLNDVRIFQKECRALARAGYEVVLVGTGEPPDSESGIRVVTVETSSHRLARMTATSWRMYRAAAAVDADVYHFHDPELIPVGMLLKLRGKRVIYDVHEDVPADMLGKDYLPPIARRMASWTARAVEWMAARMFDRVVVARSEVAPRFPARKTLLVQNFAAPGELAPAEGPSYPERPEQVVYVGVTSAIRGMAQMVRAMDLVPGDSRLVLVGAIADDLHRELESLPGWDRVDAMGFRDRNEVAAILGRSRAGLVLFQPHPNHMAAQPTKIFEYMSAGLPVIASDFPRWREFLGPLGCAQLVDPTSPSAIAAGINWVLEHATEAEEMGRRGRALAESRFNWDAEARRLVAMYADLLGGAPEPRLDAVP